ncbi:hypothetical protein [Alloyangia pacifica]|uniref:hypothetical protein n=1 Tax=Alloyangia pacifica TaxID=311180 RepID=UPI001CD6E9FD|nr:hypothetical protein [Alloyangia pacifica]MCA0997946.1 hypothetical protein [Alloyangia pacifica]
MVPEKELLFSATPPVAEAWAGFELGVTTVRPDAADVPDGGILSDLLQIGALEALSTSEGPARVACCETLELAGLCVVLAFEDADLRDELMPSFAHLATAPRRGDDHVVIQRDADDGAGHIGIGRRDEEIDWVAPHEAVPLLKIKMTEVLFDHTDHVMLHAAQLERAGRCLLLLGDAGAGKSTLATALEPAGFRLQSDDIVVMSQTGKLGALPFPVTLKEGSWRLLEHRRDEIDGAAQHLRPDALSVRYVGLTGDSSWMKAGWILVLDRQESGPASISELSLSDVFGALLRAAWSGEDAMSPDVFEAMAACLHGAKFGRLTYSDLPRALEVVSRFCEE